MSDQEVKELIRAGLEAAATSFRARPFTGASVIRLESELIAVMARAVLNGASRDLLAVEWNIALPEDGGPLVVEPFAPEGSAARAEWERLFLGEPDVSVGVPQ